MTRRDLTNDERLADWVDGRLGEAEIERLEAEFRVDPRFREAAERYRRTVGAMRRALQDESAPSGLADRIAARVEAEGSARRIRWLPLVGSLAAAAALVMVFFVVRGGVSPEPAATDELAAGESRVGDEARRVAGRPVDARDEAPAPGAVSNREDAEAAEGLTAGLETVTAEAEVAEVDAADSSPRFQDALKELHDDATAATTEAQTEGLAEVTRSRRAGVPDEKSVAAEDFGANLKGAPRAPAEPAPDPDRPMAAGSQQDVVVVVELPPSVVVPEAKAAEPGVDQYFLGAARDDAPAAGVAPTGEAAGRVSLDALRVEDPWARYSVNLLREVVYSTNVSATASQAPILYASPELVSGGARPILSLEFSGSRVADRAVSEARDGATRGYFTPQSFDLAFEFVGSPDQMVPIVRELSERSRQLGGSVLVQRTPPVTTASGVGGGGAAQPPGRRDDEPTVPRTWIVVRPGPKLPESEKGSNEEQPR